MIMNANVESHKNKILNENNNHQFPRDIITTVPLNCNFDALPGVAQWIESWPVNQKVPGSIPNQGSCRGCGPGPQ